MKKNFSQNLRELCTISGTVSHVCREIGINRHQFDRYLKGESLPAAYNLRRISTYFKVLERDLFEPNEQFLQKYQQHSRHSVGTPVDILSSTFADQHKRMRRYLGYYHVYVASPTWEGRILCGLTHLYEKNGYVASRTLQRAKSKDESIRQRARFEGLSSYRGNRIYVVEREDGEDGSVVETVLFAAHRQQVNYLRGLTLGVASRPRLVPYFSRTIWKRISERLSAREVIQACGVYGLNSRNIAPTIREFLQTPTENLPL